ncbi:MAG: hypothetical protein IIZ67_03980 [Bacilli bacterium]|nr:hypothetical protein [Bacilli bacterium]
MEDLEFIKRFSKVSIKKACKIAKVNRENLYNGKVKPEKVKKVKRVLESEIAKLYIIEDKEGE